MRIPAKPDRVLRFLCILALVLIGFGHRQDPDTDPAAGQNPPALSAYLLPGLGSLAICSSRPSEPERPRTAGKHCVACRLTSTLHLPEAGRTHLVVALFKGPRHAVGETAPARRHTAGSQARPRAPPRLTA